MGVWGLLIAGAMLAEGPPAWAAAPSLSAAAPTEGPRPEEPPREQGRGLVVPDLDIFFPEGEFDLRLNRLIDRVFFEGQVRYDFVDGDITAFLRYRYYGYQRIYQLSVFDSIEFEGVEELSDEFERVRGVLFLAEWPRDFFHRTFFAAELDGISSNKEAADSGKVNTFLRLGYQIGTPDDSRSNAIVGESRAQVQRLFTPYRAIGPGDAGFTSALTWGFDVLGADFDYLQLETEALRRFDLPGGLFLIGRLRHGTFLYKGKVGEMPGAIDPGGPTSPAVDPTRGYLIPRDELFRLDGRDNLKLLGSRDRGTEQLHTTWELLIPWFVEEDRPFLRAHWRTWYWVLYAGYGTLGVDRKVYTDFSNYVQDVGVGFQASFDIKGYTLFVSALVGEALEEGSDLKFRFSFKSYH